MARKKKTTKARRRVHATKQHDPVTLAKPGESEWAQYEPAELKTAPHSFIIYRGKVGRWIKELMNDLRHVMEPYTASNLKMTKGNVIKDYISIASYFNVTHLCILSRTTMSPYFKICRIPRGPSLTFRILDYSLARDVLASLRKQVTYEMQFSHHPLLIMNNFSGTKHLEIVSATFQNMFPPININTVQLRAIRRVLMLNYNKEDDSIDFRHFTITHNPVGVSKGIKKLLIGKSNRIPNLGNCTDISDFLKKDGYGSESEAEDTSETVALAQKLATRGTKGLDEVAIKLVELGPRLKLQLIKVEEGILDGEVLYHKLEDKTDEEKLAIRKMKIAKRKLKEKRIAIQNENLERKLREKELHKKKCLDGMGFHPQEEKDTPEEDAEWYRKEVGMEPDQETFAGSSASSRPPKDPRFQRKRKGDKLKNRTGQFDPKRPRISKFAKLKEKAKQMKKDKQKNADAKAKRLERKARQTEAATGGFNRFKSKGSGTYSKPSRSKMSKKKPGKKPTPTKRGK